MTGDSQDRRRAIEETDRSFAVEASAGTGKTTTLVERILWLVLKQGPGGEPVPLSEICAITFTEKAAGEMKVRLRREFERKAAGHGCELARAALRDLESASLSTFHAFAVSLLKERPLEAGLDPRFTTMDENESALFFSEVWEVWLQRALVERNPVLERALRAGVELDALEGLARTLRAHARTAGTFRLVPPMSENELQDQLRIRIQTAQGFLKKVIDPEDTLAVALEHTIEWLYAPFHADAPRRSGGKGAKGKWADGKTDIDQVRAFIAEVCEFSSRVALLPEQRMIDDLVRWMTADFLGEWRRQKRERGLLDFDDQLALARDLLAGSRAVRRDFQKRYAALLVDEFQDTDALQLEIVLLLSSADLNETDPRRLRPAPGRLFLVGDPKQSIYRFRRADIETYLEIAAPEKLASMQLEKLQLSQNFRSVPPILRFVDAAFAGVMRAPDDGGRYQPDYAPFGQGARSVETPARSVYIFGDTPDPDAEKSLADEFAGRECTRIANLIGKIRGSSEWQVKDSGRLRVPGYGDIAILLPVLTRSNLLEEALRDSGIPYVLEGGKFYYSRSEVGSAIQILRAVANPNDTVALYASLRSIFFGISDEDLVRVRIESLPLDYRKEVPTGSVLHRPYQILRDLHRLRHERPASETLERLFQTTGAREVLATRGMQSVANLAKLVRTLRGIQSGRPFSQVIDLISEMNAEGQAETESRLMEEKSDAVRILTIHKAKGLDFPIVLAAGFGFRRNQQSGNFLFSAHGRKDFALKMNVKGNMVRTAGWDELAKEDNLREDAELVRLLYVALTRAKDHLFLSAHTSGWVRDETDPSRIVLAAGRTRLAPISQFLSDCICGRLDLSVNLDTSLLDAANPEPVGEPQVFRDWAKLAKQESAELARLLAETPSSIRFRTPADSKAAEVAVDSERGIAQDRAIKLGNAFHDLMQQIDLADAGASASLAAVVAQRHQLSAAQTETLESMVSATLKSSLVERARKALEAGGRLFRELPFVRPGSTETSIEEGKIDLLFEEQGTCVLVDYKTDTQVAGVTKYSEQVLSYVRALQSVGVRIGSAYVLWARTGSATEIPLGSDATAAGFHHS